MTPHTNRWFPDLAHRDGNIIQGNRIANTTSAGIWLEGLHPNTIRRNSIYANPFKGIFLNLDANNNLPAPSFSLSAVGGSGTTCPNCTVELFLDEGNQGRFYLGSVNADGAGAFSFPALCPLPYPYITTTATDLLGNTSEFSDYQVVPWDCSRFPSLHAYQSRSRHSQRSRHLPVDPLRNELLSGLAGALEWALPAHHGALKHAGTGSHPVLPVPAGWRLPVTVFTPAPGGGNSGVLVVIVAPPIIVNLPMLMCK